jgi:hypothetical protein
MKKSTIDRERTVVAHDQASEVSQTGIGAFHDPSPLVTSQDSSVLGAGRTRFLLCGQISSIPRCRKRLRSGSLS